MTRTSRCAAALALLLVSTAAPAHAVASPRVPSVDTVLASDQGGDLASPWTVLLRQPYAATSGVWIDNAVQLGTADVVSDVVRLDGGAIRSATGPSGVGAFDYPGFDASSTPSRAVLRVRNTTSNDALAPGRANFVFGADFALDATSTGTRVDNGDNLVQRGLYADSSQYKIDVDGGNLSCRIKGSAGSVMVKSSVDVRPGAWYRVRCSRVSERVHFVVTRFLSDGTTRTSSDTRWGGTGALSWPDTRTPVSVGGKLNVQGQIVTSTTDQFNGRVGKPMLNISE